jgi:hypothetical protein
MDRYRTIFIFLAMICIGSLIFFSMEGLYESEKNSDPRVNASFGASNQGVSAEKGEINLTVMLSSPNSCHDIYIDESSYNESKNYVEVDIGSRDTCDDNVGAPSVIQGPFPKSIHIETYRIPEKVYIDHFERREFNVSEISED